MSVLRRKRTRPQNDVERHIRHELAEILPILRIEQCAIELQAFDPATGTAVLLIKGGCAECDCSPATFIQGIETQLKLKVWELRAVLAKEEPAV
jgi:Fe-S cluster biogenesis protein NfuA